jgi:hypothetical protein
MAVEWIGRFVFVQVAAPTRSALDEYRSFQERVQRTSRAHQRALRPPGYQPVHLLAQHHEHDAVFELFRAADICVVTSLHDGMNLVCKEFVAARDDLQGVLMLSRFAGAARELSEALIVNPVPRGRDRRRLHRAATMPAAEQRERMASLRSTVREFNVFRWAGRMLADAGRWRLRARIEARVRARAQTDRPRARRPGCSIFSRPRAKLGWRPSCCADPCWPSISTARWHPSWHGPTTPGYLAGRAARLGSWRRGCRWPSSRAGRWTMCGAGSDSNRVHRGRQPWRRGRAGCQRCRRARTSVRLNPVRHLLRTRGADLAAAGVLAWRTRASRSRCTTAWRASGRAAHGADPRTAGAAGLSLQVFAGKMVVNVMAPRSA